MTDTPSAAAACCCLGLVGNVHFKCLARGLDLGHCGRDCDQRPDCIEQHTAEAERIKADA